MSDQAHELRQLISRSAAPRCGSAGPRTVSVCGGKGGVGTTTIALHVALALVRDGRRTVFVDAASPSGGLAAHCQLAPGWSWHEVIAGRRSVHEALQAGPGGLLILPGCDATTSGGPNGQRHALQLLNQLHELERFADLVVLDVGVGSSPHAQSFLQHCEQRLIVSTTDNVSVMDTYALFKQSGGWLGAIVVNQAADVASGREVEARLTLAARRFLGARILTAGVVLADRRLTELATACDAGVARAVGLESLADWIVQSCEADPQGRPQLQSA